MSAPVFQAATTAFQQTASSFSLGPPAATASGDLLIAFQSRTGTALPSAPTGGTTWNAFSGNGTFPGSNTFSGWWKFTGGSEPGTYTFDGGALQTSDICIIRITGADNTLTPEGQWFNTYSFSSSGTASYDTNAGGHSTLSSNTLLVAAITAVVVGSQGIGISDGGSDAFAGANNTFWTLAAHKIVLSAGAIGQFRFLDGVNSERDAATFLIVIPSQPPDIVPSRQAFQKHHEIPDLRNWWYQTRIWPIPVKGPTPPPTRQLSQRYHTLPDLQDWWYQTRVWPVLVEYIPTPAYRRSLNYEQLVYQLPDYTAWWQQRKMVPVLSSIFVTQEGYFGIYNSLGQVAQLGAFRIQNLSVEGYEVFVGTDSLPDLTQPPAGFSTTLPISVPVTPPVSGLRTFYVLVRARDSYGLESQNSYYQTFTIDSSGNLFEPLMTPPSDLKLYPLSGGYIKILANYAGWGVDQFPAANWRVYVGTSPPNPATDPTVAVVPVTGKSLAVTVGNYAPGTYYVAVVLYRATDNTLSASITGSVVLPLAPGEVTAVSSGFDQP